MFDLTFAFLFLRPVNGLPWIRRTQLIAELISIKLLFYAILNFCTILAHGIYIKTRETKTHDCNI